MGIISIAGALAKAGARARADHLRGEREGEAELRRRSLEDLDRAAAEETRTIARRSAEEQQRAREQQARFREQQLANERTRAEAAQTQAEAARTRAARAPAPRSTRAGTPASSTIQDAITRRQDETARKRHVATRVRELTKPDPLTLSRLSYAEARRQAMQEADDIFGAPTAPTTGAPVAAGAPRAPDPSSPTFKADLWERLVEGGVPPEAATAEIARRYPDR